jgi:Polyketide cyclase / dehydrase and lipid transport
MSTIEESIEVHVPVATAYNQWTQFEEFPRFMEGVEQVRYRARARRCSAAPGTPSRPQVAARPGRSVRRTLPAPCRCTVLAGDGPGAPSRCR